MKKVTGFILSLALVCLVSVNAWATVIELPTWTYTLTHTLKDNSNDQAIDIDFYNLYPAGGSAATWGPASGTTHGYYFTFPLTEFNFWDLSRDLDATMTSTLTLNDGNGEEIELVLDFLVKATGYGDEYSLLLAPENNQSTGFFTTDGKKYAMKFDIYDFESGDTYAKYVNGDFVGGDVDAYDFFELDYKVSIESWEILTIENPQPTPEPATMLLTGLGLAGMGFVKRRKKNS